MSKKIRIEYSLIRRNGRDQRSLQELLQAVSSISREHRLYIDQETKYRMSDLDLSQNGRYFMGNVYRVRDDDLPPVANNRGELRDLELGDDEGLGEENAFQIDTQLGIIAYQANRFGVSLSRLLTILGNLSEMGGYLSAEPILEEDVLAKALSFQKYSKIEVKLANLGYLDQTGLDDPSLAELTESARAFDAPRLTVSMSMGHAGGSLNLRRIRDLIRSVWDGRNNRAVTSMLISGKEPDKEKATILDLIEEIMKDFYEIHPNENRRYTYEARVAAVGICYSGRWNEFERRYG